jgi:hypothetical protein
LAPAEVTIPTTTAQRPTTNLWFYSSQSFT